MSGCACTGGHEPKCMERQVSALAAENERLRDGLFAESQAHEQLKREHAQLRQQLEEAPSRQVFEAHVRMLAETRARLQTVEGERDAALKAGRVLVAANTRHFNEAREACEALQAAQRENGVLRELVNVVEDCVRRGAAWSTKGNLPTRPDLVEREVEFAHLVIADYRANAAMSAPASPAAPVRYNGGVRCDTTKGPCACGAWH